MNDLRLAARLLLKSPAFSIVTVVLLSLGIGANAIFFSAFDHILLRQLPVRNPGGLVRFVQDIPGIGVRGGYFAFPYYEAVRKDSTTLASVFGSMEMNAVIGEPAQQVRIHLVTPEYFESLGVPALIGRTLTATDATDSEGAPPAVLSYGFWMSRFHGSPQVLSQTISLKGHRFAVVGVMPKPFNGVSIESSPDIRVSLRAFPLLAQDGQTLERSGLELTARLKPGIGVSRSEAESSAIWSSAMKKYYADDVLKRGVKLDPMERGISLLRDRFSTALKLLAASAALLQLIVCANLAGLLIARNASRARDTAVRLAIGASRRRLIEQMLAESLLLTLAGLAGGILLAYTAAPLLVNALPPLRDVATHALSLSIDLRPDWRVLAFSLAISALTLTMIGLGPAISASRMSLDQILRGARTTGPWRSRQFLLVCQIALCTVLLSGAALLVQTFQRLDNANPGFDRGHLATFTTAPSLSGYNSHQANALRLALTSRILQIPGVAGVATASRPLMRGSGLKTTVAPEGQRIAPSDALNTTMATVSREYFDVVGMKFLAGRQPLDSDYARDKINNVVVNETFVRHFFPATAPLGRTFGGGPNGIAQGSNRIVGVVSDAKFRSMREPIQPTFFVPSLDTDFTLYVRTRTRPEELIQPVRQALSQLDPSLPFTEIHTLELEIQASTAPERLTSQLASAFSLTASLLAAVGIYGLFAFAVAQRKREIGVRMAVGASPNDIAAMFGLQALLTAAAGIAIGTAISLLIAPAVASLLYGIPPRDTCSFLFAGLSMLLAALAATAVPAIRAAHIHPADALRQE